jgi:putative transcriptional regulator
MLLAHTVGMLGPAHDLVVAAHVALCADCRVRTEADMAVGGRLLDALPPTPIASGALARVMAKLNTLVGGDGDGSVAAVKPPAPGTGDLPVALRDMLRSARPSWLAPGIRQAILLRRSDGTLRLLRIGPGKALPRHGHHGTELTLVLQGAFADERSRYAPGDLAEADEHVDHRPVAEHATDCVCLVATLGRLRFGGVFGSLIRNAAR